MRQPVRFSIAALWLALAALTLPVAAARAWDWKLPPDKFQELSVFERNQYQKAEKLFAARPPDYKQAALEFDVFTKQYPDSTALTAAVFMEALSTQEDTRRYAAIKLYQRLLDFWPTDPDYAPAAQYEIGRAYLDSGDTAKGMKEMEKLVTNDKYNKHPLAAEALVALATNAQKNTDMPTYCKYKLQAYKDFYDANRPVADQSRDDLVRYYVSTENYPKIEETCALHNWAKPREDAGYFWYLWDRANEVCSSWYPKPEQAKDQAAAVQAFLDYWKKSGAVAEKASAWEYNRRTLQWLLQYQSKKKDEWSPLATAIAAPPANDDMVRQVVWLLLAYGQFDSAMPITANIKDKQAFYPWFFNELAQRNMLDQAEHVLDQIEDPSERLWRTYDLRGRQNKWKEAALALKQLADTDQKRAGQANHTLVWVYMDRTGQYDEAIKLANQISDQPWSNFQVAECYRREKDAKKSAAALWEIENFFPDHASEAALRRAQMYDSLGMRDQAIGDYRRILKVYKDKPEASTAHQVLQSWGVATGGGELAQ